MCVVDDFVTAKNALIKQHVEGYSGFSEKMFELHYMHLAGVQLLREWM